MATTERKPAGTLKPGLPIRQEPAIAYGRALPDVPWFIPRADRKYNVLMTGGQGSGKSSVLCRLALNDIYDPTTCTVVLDMKGSLSRRLLRMCPDTLVSEVPNPDGGVDRGQKRVWYLDLERPAFGMTPLRVEAGWNRNELAGEFARIADAMLRVLLDLFPGQIMGSSEDIIERSTIGAMAIAWWEHEKDCQGRNVDPTTESFIGSVEVLASMLDPTARRQNDDPANVTAKAKRKDPPNPWHVAAGKACNMLPNLDRVADDFLYGIPARVRENKANIAQRMEAPANKIRPLVGAAVNARRFVEHRYHLSISEIVRRRDVLIVNPRLDRLGEDQASIICNFIVHLIDQEMKRQAEQPGRMQPRVSLIADEAHRLITDTLMTMVATHREAGFDCAFVVQFLAQIGADHPDAAKRKKMLDGVGNLMQHKIVFRASNAEDAEYYAANFRSVYETMVRADPESRARTPADPSRISSMADWNALVSLISSGRGSNAGGTNETVSGASSHGGANRLPVFTTATYEMRDPDDLPDGWAKTHMARQHERFPDYPENMTALARSTPPPGLLHDTSATAPTPFEERLAASRQAEEVAQQDMGNIPGRDAPAPPAAADEPLWSEAELAAVSTVAADDPFEAAWASEVLKSPRRPTRAPETPATAPSRSGQPTPSEAAASDHVRVNERRVDPGALHTPRDTTSLRHALLPTRAGAPPEDLPVLPAVQEAAKAHAAAELSDGHRGPWILAIVEQYSAVVDTLFKAARRVAPGPQPEAPNEGASAAERAIAEALRGAHTNLGKVAAAAPKVAGERAAGAQIEPLIHHVRDDLQQARAAFKENRMTGVAMRDTLVRLVALYAVAQTFPRLLDLLQEANAHAAEANTDAATNLVGQGVAALRETLLKLQKVPTADGEEPAIEGPLEQLEDAVRKLDATVSKHRQPPLQVAHDLSAPLAETLVVAARVNYVSQPMLCELRGETVVDRTMRRHLSELERLGLLALTQLQIRGRRGRGPQLYTVTPRGRAVGRELHKIVDPNANTAPRELLAERKVPADGRQGNSLKHDLAVQVATIGMRHALSREANAIWMTTQMSGGFFDPRAVIGEPGGLTEEHLMPAPGLKMTGARIEAATKIEPDVTIQVSGPIDGTRQVVDLMLEVDLTGRPAYNASKIVAYDHFLAGWWMRTRRYGQQRKRRPIVLFVARNAQAVMPLLTAIDKEMRIGFAARAVYDEASQWYPGREHVAVTAVDWIVGGQLRAVAPDPLPVDVRGSDTPMKARYVDIVPPSWWATKPAK